MATKARTLLGKIRKLATPVGSPKHFAGIQISRSSSAVSQVDWQKLEQKYQEAGSGPRNIHVGFGFSSWALIFWVTICTLHPQSFFFLNKCFNCPNNALSHLYFIFFIRLVFENRMAFSKKKMGRLKQICHLYYIYSVGPFFLPLLTLACQHKPALRLLQVESLVQVLPMEKILCVELTFLPRGISFLS